MFRGEKYKNIVNVIRWFKLRSWQQWFKDGLNAFMVTKQTIRKSETKWWPLCDSINLFIVVTVKNESMVTDLGNLYT